jgi:hypothetical protein
MPKNGNPLSAVDARSGETEDVRPEDRLHTWTCVRYAATTGRAYCIDSCAQAARAKTGLREKVQRLWDLVRFKRHDLFSEEIISCDEFAALVEDHAAVDRLETNDALRAELANYREFSITAYLSRQWEWSKRTFGPGKRTLGIIDHITKELREIAAKPDDLSEWVDVAILAMDGYWRHGGTPEQFMRDMQAKQDKNFARVWPAPTSEDVAVEHDRTGERGPA